MILLNGISPLFSISRRLSVGSPSHIFIVELSRAEFVLAAIPLRFHVYIDTYPGSSLDNTPYHNDDPNGVCTVWSRVAHLDFFKLWHGFHTKKKLYVTDSYEAQFRSDGCGCRPASIRLPNIWIGVPKYSIRMSYFLAYFWCLDTFDIQNALIWMVIEITLLSIQSPLSWSCI